MNESQWPDQPTQSGPNPPTRRNSGLVMRAVLLLAGGAALGAGIALGAGGGDDPVEPTSAVVAEVAPTDTVASAGDAEQIDSDQTLIDAIIDDLNSDGDLPAAVDPDCMARAFVAGVGGAAAAGDLGLTPETIAEGRLDDLELPRVQALAVTDAMMPCGLTELFASGLVQDGMPLSDARCIAAGIDQDALRDTLASAWMAEAEGALLAEAADDVMLSSMIDALGTCDVDPGALLGDGASDDNTFAPVEASVVEIEGVSVGATTSGYAFGTGPSETGAETDLVVISLPDGNVLTRYGLDDEAAFVIEASAIGGEIWIGIANNNPNRDIPVFDPSCACIFRAIQTGSNSIGIIREHQGLVWIDDFRRSTSSTPFATLLTAIDPTTGNAVAEINVDAAGQTTTGLQDIVAAGDWLVATDSERIWIVDPGSLTLAGTMEIGGESLSAPVSLGTTVAITDLQRSTLHVVDPATRTIETVEVATPDDDFFSLDLLVSHPLVGALDGLIWFTVTEDRALVAYDPATLEEVHRVTFDGEGFLSTPMQSLGHLWLQVDNEVVAVDPTSGAVATSWPGLLESGWLQTENDIFIETRSDFFDPAASQTVIYRIE